MSLPALPATNLLPEFGPEDDKADVLPANATTWQKIRGNPVVKRVTYVLIAIAVGAVVLLIVNLGLAPRAVKCTSVEDCRQVRRVNTILVGVKSVMNLLVAFILLFVILGAVGIDLRILLATAGILGLIIGLAAQPAIKSFIAGLNFLIYDRFSIGDFVTLHVAKATTVQGIVMDFSTQATTVQDLSGARHFVPNGNIVVVVNYSQNPQRAQVDLHVSYEGPINTVLHAVRQMSDDIATESILQGLLTQPPVVKGVTSNGPQSYVVSVSAITQPNVQRFVERYMRYRLLDLMQRLGVHAVSPQHVHTAPIGSEAAAAGKTLAPLPPLEHPVWGSESAYDGDVTPRLMPTQYVISPKRKAGSHLHTMDEFQD